jgi:hypothetical protein
VQRPPLKGGVDTGRGVTNAPDADRRTRDGATLQSGRGDVTTPDEDAVGIDLEPLGDTWRYGRL